MQLHNFTIKYPAFQALQKYKSKSPVQTGLLNWWAIADLNREPID